MQAPFELLGRRQIQYEPRYPNDPETSAFVEMLQQHDWEDVIGPDTKIYLPINEAVEQLLKILNDERKKASVVKSVINRQQLAQFVVGTEVIMNHFQLKNSGIDAFCFPASNFKCFVVDEILEEPGGYIETIDNIEVIGHQGQFYKIAGMLVTPVQMENLMYFARTGKSQNPKEEFIEREEALIMIKATSITIGTDMKVIMDLVYNHRKPQWSGFAEIEFQFYNLLREFIDYRLTGAVGKAVKTKEEKLRLRLPKHERAVNNFNVKRDLRETLTLLENVAKKLLRNLEKYKVCYNDKEWIDGENIADIPYDEYIRLSNGACWATENLIEHFKQVKGFNRPPNIKGYPTKTLFNKWAPDIDREHLFEHPIAQKHRLREWYEERNRSLKDYSRIISDRTMDTLKDLLEVLASKGPAFVAALRRELSRDALIALQKAKGVISDTGEYQEEIVNTVNEKLKSQATFGLTEYLKRLDKKELDALDDFEPDLQRILKQCSEGKACVWYTADIVRNTYNDIAEVKGVEKIFVDKQRFDHVTPTTLEY